MFAARSALTGRLLVRAQGDGLFTGVVVDPGQIGEREIVPFEMEAFLTLVFNLDNTSLLTVRGGGREEMPMCRRGGNC